MANRGDRKPAHKVICEGHLDGKITNGVKHSVGSSVAINIHEGAMIVLTLPRYTMYGKSIRSTSSERKRRDKNKYTFLDTLQKGAHTRK